jgi:hypothetical protein
MYAKRADYDLLSIKITAFLAMTPCSLVNGHQSFEGAVQDMMAEIQGTREQSEAVTATALTRAVIS